MRCYNAAMSKPFQFSMHRMLVVVSLFCTAAFLISWWLRISTSGEFVMTAVMVSGLLVGACIGLLFGRIVLGMTLGGMAGVAVCFLVVLARTVC
jgi:hypothetical protein